VPRFAEFQEGVAWISSTRRIGIAERSSGIVASLLSSWNGGLTRAKGAEQRALRLARFQVNEIKGLGS
jgi:hypothetical protein